MINTADILETINMIRQENLDIRTITMGISLLDCCSEDEGRLLTNIYDKITKSAENLVKTGEEIEKKTRLRRIPNILGIVTTGYHACKASGRTAEWKSFVAELAADPFFKGLFPKEYRRDISAYYNWLASLILANNGFLLARTLDAYQWYCDHIKHKK